MKSVVTLKTNPGILIRDGGIKMWMWLCVERGSYLGSGNRVRRGKLEEILQGKKDATRVVHISCDDDRELFRIAKQRVGEKRNVVGISCLKDESDAVKVNVDD